VRWCLHFATQDLTALDAGARVAAGHVLAALQGQAAKAWPPPADAITETHRHLHDCIEALANGRHCTVWTPETVWQILPPASPPGARYSAPLTRRSAAGQQTKHMPSMVVWAFLDDLDVVGADRLRACQLVEKTGQRCGRIFLAKDRRERYCDPKHAQRAAWLEYEPTRKGNRK
jgi:hypothetical protein